MSDWPRFHATCDYSVLEKMVMFFVYEGIVLLGIASILFIIAILLLKNRTSAYPNVLECKSEHYYFNEVGQQKQFPSFNGAYSCYLSIVIPAYNEENRLPAMMEQAIGYLERRCTEESKFTYEIIIVDDGSTDATSKVAREYTNKLGSEKVRVLTLDHNRGKGGAVRLGMMRCRGEMLLFADADGATRFTDISKLEKSLLNLSNKNTSESLGIVCGSRAHLEEESVAQRSYFRTVLMYGFHMLVWLLTVRNVKDTQCGFKLFTRRTAQILFKSLHLERWAFDVELLYMAEMLHIPVREVAVDWKEIEGSKITPVISWLQMGFDLIFIWLRYFIGAWKVNPVLMIQS